MKYTENYRLPQWDETDRIMRTDFNRAMSDIENGMSQNRAMAETAHQEAVTLPYVTGNYVGDGTHRREISLGFRPQFVIVSGLEEGAYNSRADLYFSATCGGVTPGQVKLTEDGFSVMNVENLLYPSLNAANHSYDYIAFR